MLLISIRHSLDCIKHLHFAQTYPGRLTSRNKHSWSLHSSRADTVAPLLYLSVLSASSRIPWSFGRGVSLLGMFLWPELPRHRLKQQRMPQQHMVKNGVYISIRVTEL